MNPDRLAGLLAMLQEDGHITPQAARILTLTNNADRHQLVAELERRQRENNNPGGYADGYSEALHEAAQLIGDPDPRHQHCDCPEGGTP